MKRNLVISMLFLALGFVRLSAGDPLYEIKAYEGTLFFCWVYDGGYSLQWCGGIITEGDSTILELSNEKTFYESLFKNAKYSQIDEFYYMDAYNIIFPKKEEFLDNAKLAEKLRFDFNENTAKNETVVYFELKTGKKVCISFCMVKALFLSVKDNSLRQRFTCTIDVDESLMPPIDSVNIPLTVFEYSKSDHSFIAAP